VISVPPWWILRIPPVNHDLPFADHRKPLLTHCLWLTIHAFLIHVCSHLNCSINIIHVQLFAVN
jgi:hypothetical protein